MKYYRVRFLAYIFLLQVAPTQASTESLNELMTTWLKLEAQKGTLSDRWQTRRQQIQQKLDLFEVERYSLQEVLDASKKEKSEVGGNRLQLLESQVELEKSQQSIGLELKKSALSIQKLAPRLPPPLQTQWQVKMPVVLDSKASNSERVEGVLAMMKMIADFDKRIALHRGMIEIPMEGETLSIMVNQIYAGVGVGWYVSDTGDYFGYGEAQGVKWTWLNGDEASNYLGKKLLASDLLAVLHVLENPSSASYLPLPIKVGE